MIKIGDIVHIKPHQRVEWFGGTESENVIGLVAKYGGSIGGERIWQVLVNGEMWTIFEDYLVEINENKRKENEQGKGN